MLDVNSNDIAILRSVVDKDEKRGTNKAKASTISQIVSSSGLSNTKVRSAIKKLEENGFIAKGIKLVNKNTYYITQVGVDYLKEITKSIL